jgi:micrococcal nuclease
MLLRLVAAATLAIAAWAAAQGPVMAHGGGLNSSGCHNETATGGYHCHRSSEPKPPKEKKQKEPKQKKAKPAKANKSKSQNSGKKKRQPTSKNSQKNKSTSPTTKGIIKECYDGDTCTTTSGEKIRLACIDTPEMGTGSAATAAQRRTEQLVVGKEVTIKRYESDRYGRTVAEIFTPGGQSSSQVLVNDGLAEVYTQYASNCSWAR